MNTLANTAPPVRAGSGFAAGLAFTAAVLALAAPLFATQPPGEVTTVEEDWELVIREPDPGSNAPQVTCVMAPVGNLDGVYAAFDVNHRSQPYYVPGGLQLQLWNGESVTEHHKYPNTAVAATANETVRWTTRMRLGSDGTLNFEVRNGTSETWGNFGGQGYLRVGNATTLSNLNAYVPAVSVEHSGVGFAGNRVQSLTLLRVRRTYASGTVAEDNTPRSVHVE